MGVDPSIFTAKQTQQTSGAVGCEGNRVRTRISRSLRQLIFTPQGSAIGRQTEPGATSVTCNDTWHRSTSLNLLVIRQNHWKCEAKKDAFPRVCEAVTEGV